MKTILIAATFLLCTEITGTAQTKMKTDREHQGLKDPVHRVSSHIYNVTDTGAKQQKIWVYSEEELFNRKGNLLSSKTHNANTDFNDSTLFAYDSLDNLSEEKSYDQFHLLSNQTNTVYGVNGNILSEREIEYWKTDNGEIEDSMITIDTYSYNDLNLVSEIWRTDFMENGRFSQPRLYIRNIYEDSGRIRHQYEYRSREHPEIADSNYLKKNRDGKAIESYNSQTHYLYTYDSQGRFKITTHLMKSTGKTYTNSWEYDKWGNRTVNKTVDNEGTATGDIITSTYYSIDRHGNWRKVKSYKNGKLVYYCQRNIRYY